MPDFQIQKSKLHRSLPVCKAKHKKLISQSRCKKDGEAGERFLSPAPTRTLCPLAHLCQDPSIQQERCVHHCPLWLTVPPLSPKATGERMNLKGWREPCLGSLLVSQLSTPFANRELAIKLWTLPSYAFPLIPQVQSSIIAFLVHWLPHMLTIHTHYAWNFLKVPEDRAYGRASHPGFGAGA